MHYPSFIAEMAGRAKRRNLWLGIWSGYAIVVAFIALALAGWWQELVPWSLWVWVLIGLKLVTNTVALVALRLERLVLELTGLNTLTDIVTMTGAVYFTGAIESPLFPMYVIEITVIALLANLPITILCAVVIVGAYTAMCLLVYAGWLSRWPSPTRVAAPMTASYLITHLITFGLFIAVPTLYASLVLRSLAAKERALEQRTAELEAARDDKARFMAHLTHDMRSPLFGITGMCDLLEAGQFGAITAAQREACQVIRDSAGQLLSLVDDLLQMTQARVARLTYSPSTVDVRALIDRVVATVGGLRAGKAMTVSVEVADDVPAIVTDSGKLNQIAINLLVNAIKYTPENGRVSVTVRRAGRDDVVIRVTDTGVGIAPDQLERIFEPFEQIDGATDATYGGVGLGLAVVKQLVDLLGGTIDVTSELGRGSSFAVRLPRRGRSEATA